MTYKSTFPILSLTKGKFLSISIIYNAMLEVVVKEDFQDIGIIETPICTFKTGDLEPPKR